ncbi:MAG: CPBP family intramembrane metalloprotease [Planctomycetaceae bacterium]|nr:CPBP family intramembrane metalloprotease [Planctomycetaceae bacterium]
MHTSQARTLLIGLEGALVLVAILLGWVLGQPPLQHASLSERAAAWGVAGTLPMLAALVIITRWPQGPWRSLVELIDELLVPMLRGWSFGEMALAAALAGFGEEMLFRGVLQEVLQRVLVDWGLPVPWLAILAAGFLFGLAHAISLAYVVFATLVGIYLGWLYVWTGDLTAPIVTHALYDFVALVYLGRFRGDPSSY